MLQKTNIILGVDPGTRVTGYGLIQHSSNGITALDYGCIRPPYNESLSKRYFIIYEGIEKIIKRYHPDAVSVETQFMNKNVQSAMKLGMARGVVMIAATKYNIPIFEYAPKKAKKAVVGNGRASKEQVQKMVQMLLQLSSPPHPEDAADALALALCHAHMLKLEKYK